VRPRPYEAARGRKTALQLVVGVQLYPSGAKRLESTVAWLCPDAVLDGTSRTLAILQPCVGATILFYLF